MSSLRIMKNNNAKNKGATTSTKTTGSSVILEDVDDYIAPSQACVNPLFQGSSNDDSSDNSKAKEKLTAAATTTTTTASSEAYKPAEEESEARGGAVVVPRRRRRIVRRNLASTSEENGEPSAEPMAMLPEASTKKEESIKASIADCLACSGCVTTAETVLLEQRHSLSSLKARLSTTSNHENTKRAITVSPNSWADLCRYWNLNSSDTHDYCKFTTLLYKILQANIVIDGNLPLLWTWMDEANEFVAAYKNKEQSMLGKDTPNPSYAIDATKTSYYQPNGQPNRVVANIDDPNSSITSKATPVISGSCPALVCLVEKSYNSLVPYLSLTQSSMSRLGSTLEKERDVLSGNDYSIHWDHWSIMPCHDKKLEASRQDFVLGDNGNDNSGNNDNDNKRRAVDLVVTTQELVELIEEWVLSQPSSTTEAVSVGDHLKTMEASNLTNVATPADFERQVQKLITSTKVQKPQSTLITTSSVISNKRPEESSEESKQEQIQNHIAFSSGGHADFIFKYAAKELFDYDVTGVEWKPVDVGGMNGTNKKVRSARLAKKYAQQNQQHYYEAKLFLNSQDGTYSQRPEQGTMNDGTDPQSTTTCVLHFTIVHGIQTLQRALKDLDDARTSSSKPSSSSSVAQYIEAMACPYGCVNGGGSVVRSSNNGNNTNTSAALMRETPTEIRKRVQKTVSQLSVPDIEQSSSSQKDSMAQNLYTRYHVVPPMQHTMGAAAGVKVEDMQW